eukprot:s2280_g7.t1
MPSGLLRDVFGNEVSAQICGRFKTLSGFITTSNYSGAGMSGALQGGNAAGLPKVAGTSSASTAGLCSSPTEGSDSDSHSSHSTGSRPSWSRDSDSSTSRWVRTLNDSVRASDPDLRPGEPFVDIINEDGHSGVDSDPEATTPTANVNHLKGWCRPCVFHSSGGCNRSIDCSYCHLVHPPVELDHRIRKSMRDRIKRRLAPLLVENADLDAIHDQLQREAVRHPLARIRIQAYLRARSHGENVSLQFYRAPFQGDLNRVPANFAETDWKEKADPWQSQQPQRQFQ